MHRCLIKEDAVEIEGSLLGKGAYGKVIAATHKGKKLAIKLNLVDKRLSFVGSIREVDCLLAAADADIPVIKLAAIATDNIAIDAGKFRPDVICMLFERAECSLDDMMQKEDFSGSQRIHFAAQAVSAVGKLHGLGIMHRDVKPSNFLCAAGRVLLCDFGMAKHHAPFDKDTEHIMTLEYRPPEILQKRSYSFPADCWSLGCVIFEILFSKYLFEGREKTTEAWLRTEHKRLPRSLSGWRKRFPESHALKLAETDPEWEHNLVALLTGLLARDPTKRLTCAAALENPLLAKVGGCPRPGRDPSAIYTVHESLMRPQFADMVTEAHKVMLSVPWYSPRAPFLALALFDELEGHLESPPSFPREWACAILYLALKYTSDFQDVPYSDVFPVQLCKEDSMRAVSRYERLILCDFLNFRVHRDTLFEHLARFGDPLPEAAVFIKAMAALPVGEHDLGNLAEELKTHMRLPQSSRRTKRTGRGNK